MPKREIALFVVIDVILVAIAIMAAIRHVKVLYVLLAFLVLSVINGIFLIVSVLRRTAGSR